MSNIFDNMGEQAFDACSLTFGYSATWNNGTEDVTARVLFADADTARKLPGPNIDYDDENPVMEFKPSDFPNLYETIMEDADVINININGTVYIIRNAVKIMDGKVIKSLLEEDTP